MQLSIMSEAYMYKVDAALKRRLHANKSKYAELEWQKEEVRYHRDRIGTRLCKLLRLLLLSVSTSMFVQF